MTRRKTKKMKWHKCEKCGGRVYNHREKSHVCEVESKKEKAVKVKKKVKSKKKVDVSFTTKDGSKVSFEVSNKRRIVHQEKVLAFLDEIKCSTKKTKIINETKLSKGQVTHALKVLKEQGKVGVYKTGSNFRKNLRVYWGKI